MQATDVTPQRVLAELADIAFAAPDTVLKVSDKLRALEMLCRHLGLEEPAAGAVTIVDDIGPPAGGGGPGGQAAAPGTGPDGAAPAGKGGTDWKCG